MRTQSPKPSRKAALSLTAELVARVERTEPDPGPIPGRTYLTEAEFDALSDALVATCKGGPLWIFAYGSLIWKPEGIFAEHRPAIVHGWHRSFCLTMRRWRGTPDYPGLMMALDHGGACHGVVYRLPQDVQRAELGKLLRREIDHEEDIPTIRWVTATTDKIKPDGGKLRALTFYAGPRTSYYAGKLPDEEVARILARAAGHWGSCASYLFQTITKLEEYGIHDSHLWTLQALVADEIRKTT